MSKFKAGDRVRYNGKAGLAFDSDMMGKVGVVERDGGESIVDVLWDSGRRYGVFRDNIELSNDSPTCTVTRREIVPFTLNKGGGEGTPEIRIAPCASGGVDVGFGSVAYGVHFNAESLRAAAMLFNELADVLDENAREAA